jgi:hypothetical protein
MPRDLDKKTQKLKLGDLHARMRGNLTKINFERQMRRAHIDKYSKITNRRQLL